jgi:multiple sugar transport system permease protein
MTVAQAPAPVPTAGALARASAGVAPRAPATTGLRRIGEKWYTPYLFLLPHLSLFVLMIGIPFFYNIYIALSDYTFGGSETFIGLRNFQNLFDPNDFHFPVFWNGVWNTIIFVIISTPTLVTAGLGLAVLLNSKFRGRNFFRGIYFAPWTLGIGVVGLLWFWILNGTFGLLTNTLGIFGLSSPAWLTTNPWAWFSILLATVWWTVGFNTIILLAGIQAISIDLYEAATVDGANRWQQFRHITVPSLRPILLLVVTLQVIASFNLVGQPQIMTGGGPGNETRPGLLYVYETGFTGRYELGQAAAMALVIAVMMLVVSLVNFRVFNSERA